MTSINHYNDKVNFLRSQIPSRLHEGLEARCARPTAPAVKTSIGRGQLFGNSITRGMNAGAHGGARLAQGLDYLVGKGAVVPPTRNPPTGFNNSVQMQKGLLEPMLRVTANRGADLAGGVFGLAGGALGVVPALLLPVLPRIRTEATKVTETATAPAPLDVDAEAGDTIAPAATDTEIEPLLDTEATATKKTVEGKVEIAPSAQTSESVLNGFSSFFGNAGKATASAILHGATDAVLFAVHSVTGIVKGLAGAIGAFGGMVFGALYGLVEQVTYRSPVDLNKKAESLQKQAAQAQQKSERLTAEANKLAEQAKLDTKTVAVTDSTTKELKVPTDLTDEEIREEANVNADSEVQEVSTPVPASV